MLSIDRKVNTLQGRIPLCQLILGIKSQEEKTKGAQLFQSIDYIHDSSKVYLPYLKKWGPGGEGYIFQFYQSMEHEAVAMLTGLGVYLSTEHDKDEISRFFTVNHWAENQQWCWDIETKKFITPEEQMVAELVNLDSNANIIGVEAAHLSKIEQNNSKEHLTPATQMIRQQEQELIWLLHNPDLDPILSLDRPVQEIVQEVPEITI